MKVRVIIILYCLFLCAAPARLRADEEPRHPLAEAYELILAGDFGRADALLSSFQGTGPVGHYQEYLVGLRLLLMGRAGEAIAPLSAAARALPESNEIALALGRALRLGGNGAGAFAELSKLALKAPADLAIKEELVALYLDYGLYLPALNVLKSIDINSFSPDLADIYIKLLLALGQKEAALKFAEYYHLLHGDDLKAAALLALTLKENGLYLQAAAIYELIWPQNMPLYGPMLAESFFYGGLKKSAENFSFLSTSKALY